jgi:hypothetical protein
MHNTAFGSGPAASVKKNRRGKETAAGRCGRQAEERVTFHRADLRHPFHQRGWLSVRFATLEPGNCFEYPLLSGHAVSHVGPGESHLSSAFCAAAPATGKPHE